MVNRNIEEALNLGSVQVEGDDPVDPGVLKHVGNQLSRNWFPAPCLPILPCVAIVWDHHVNGLGTGPPQGVNHDQQFHQVIVDWCRGRLDDVDVVTTDTLLNVDLDFTIAEPVDG